MFERRLWLDQFSVGTGLDAVFGLPEDVVRSWSLACADDWAVGGWWRMSYWSLGLGLQLVTICRGQP